jgi:hypothetical protein
MVRAQKSSLFSITITQGILIDPCSNCEIDLLREAVTSGRNGRALIALLSLLIVSCKNLHRRLT